MAEFDFETMFLTIEVIAIILLVLTIPLALFGIFDVARIFLITGMIIVCILLILFLIAIRQISR